MLKNSKTDGFTLIELMITLAVLAIILVIAIPNMSTFSKKQAVRSTADNILLSMVYARSEALKRNENIYILPFAGSWNNGWCVTRSNTNCTVEDLNGEAVLLRSFSPSRKNLVLSGFGSQVKFNQRGMRVAGGNAFSVKDSSLPESEERCIQLSHTGRASMVTCS